VKLLSPPEYVKEAAARMRRAKKRIYLLSLVVADHPNTHELIDELEKAAERGVEVVVAADIFTFGSVLSDFYPGKYRSKDTRQAQRMARALKKAGVSFQWLGKHRLTLYNGRTHSKWCVIDDTVFAFGGVNMYQKGVDNADYMFMTEDPMLADLIVAEHKKVQDAEKRQINYPSIAHQHGKNLILFDGGIVGQSIIYRRACELAKQAEKITFVSQYAPTGRLSRLIRRTDYRAYFSRTEQADGLNVFAVWSGVLLSRLRNEYRGRKYLHAKFIIFTMPDKTRIAITGSHNFAYTGDILGTREIALETSDRSVIKQLEAFAKELKKSA